MRTAEIKRLTPEAFRPFGDYAALINPKATVIGKPPVEFYRDMLPLRLGTSSVASISVCRVGTRPAVVDVTEFHDETEEGILPLDGDVLIHVAAATPGEKPPVDRIEVFRVPQGTFVTLRRGVWHHAPLALDRQVVNVLIILPERTYKTDCTVVELPRAQRVAIAE
jgi:ureidoglycolate lyase